MIDLRKMGQYGWLADAGVLPKMLQAALPLYGTNEVSGSGNNPTIMGWADSLGVRRVYTADSVAWCGLFMGHVAATAGKGLWPGAKPADVLWALNWAKFGEEAGQPMLGDVLTFTRTGGGHVGLYIGEDATAYHVYGANQGDIVSGRKADTVGFTRIDKKRLYRARRPFMTVPPASMRPIVLAAAGALSRNEA